MLYLPIFLCYFSFNFASANDENVALCFYDQQLKDFVFLVNIASIKDNVSCANNCACNGTTFGYSNCQSCCCQRRVNMNYGRLKQFYFIKFYFLFKKLHLIYTL